MPKSPDAFRTISEVADWLGIQAHVLRFWESKFTQIKPIKRAGGRRYYRPADMLLLGGIKRMLHEDGLTIKGVQKVLREEGMNYVAALSAPLDELGQTDVSDDAADTVDMAALPAEPVKPESVVLPFESARPADPAPEPAQPAPTSKQDAAPVSEPAETFEAPDENVNNDQQPVEKETISSAKADLDAASGTAPAATDSSHPAPSQTADVSPAPSVAKPRVVDVTIPSETDIPATAATLSSALRLRKITPAAAADIAPVLSQLAALRDSMASGVSDHSPATKD
ncbi:MerR family transcriptional regulator [Sulfitobacter sp. AS59]|uniref:MerR family transcriptional regulator n=1 Tax=Sulfitobacter sp. AS59 TaxID=3135784 RepID=UPI00316D50B7